MRAQGALKIECCTVVPLTKTRSEDEDFGVLGRGELTHAVRIVMLDDCVNKAIGLFALTTDESRSRQG